MQAPPERARSNPRSPSKDYSVAAEKWYVKRVRLNDGGGMKGTIRFRYDSENDVVIATPHWNIETKEDVLVWFGQYESYIKRFARKMDVIIVLDDFKIGPTIGVVWGEYRASLHRQFTRFTYRVNSDNRVKLFVNTSGVRYNVATEEAATIEDGLEGIKAARRAANIT
jgi:hypothetical protein